MHNPYYTENLLKITTHNYFSFQIILDIEIKGKDSNIINFFL